MLDDPFEREAPLPLLEPRDLPLDFGFAFEAFSFGDDFDFVDDFDFEAGFADFEAEAFFDFGFDFGVDLVFV